MAFTLNRVMMKKVQILNWIPALVVMGVIFWFSAQSGEELPVFSWADKIVKKSGHVIGYALLAFWYWYALGLQSNRRWLAWLLAVLYAATDEYHQSFVPYRGPSIWDVLIFDSLGALLSFWLTNIYINKQKRPDNPA
jgi:VanZ like family